MQGSLHGGKRILVANVRSPRIKMIAAGGKISGLGRVESMAMLIDGGEMQLRLEQLTCHRVKAFRKLLQAKYLSKIPNVGSAP